MPNPYDYSPQSNNAFQVIRDTVSITDTLNACNLSITVDGFIQCPSQKHTDKNPSNCKVYTDTNRVYCHDCGYNGDIFDVYQTINGGTQIDALNALRKLKR